MKILIAGDFVPRERVLEKIKKNDYADIFADLKPYIEQADYSVLNLEAPIVLDTLKARPIQKVGPALSAPVETIDVIKDAGFNCVTLANNHIMDYGAQALNDTISVLYEKQILHVGAGKSLDDASKVLYLRAGSQSVAIVNFCENEFSIAGDSTSGAFPLNIVKNYHQIQEAKEHDFTGICFVNLVEFDSEYGHRRNPIGYGECIERFDKRVKELIPYLKDDDLLIITADHGNDPTWTGTDHTREKIPLIIYSKSISGGGLLPERNSFGDIGATILENFGLKKPDYILGKPIFELLK